MGSWSRDREAALAVEKGPLANSLGMGGSRAWRGAGAWPRFVRFVRSILPGAQGRTGGGMREKVLEVPRDPMVEISRAEGENLNFILTAPGSHGGFKPKKNIVGFGRDMGKNRCGGGDGAGKWLCG